MVAEWIKGLDPICQALLRIVLFVGPLLIAVPGLIWWERRLLGWMQDRVGPNRVGPFGLLQPIADAIKLFFKEDIIPATVDKWIYFIAPMIAFFPALTLGGVIPWGPTYGFYSLLTPIANVSIGVLYLLAISSLGSYGVVLAGFAGNNKYSLLGGLRASAQLISYELAMGVALAAIVLASGSLQLPAIVIEQTKPLWHWIPYLQNWYILTPYGFVAAVIFFICMVAETNRAPFDLPEAESELVAGYHTEYSSMRFATFFMGEYASLFVFSGIFATVFLGGYNFLPIRWETLAHDFPKGSAFWNFMANINYWLAPLWFFGKCWLGATTYIWGRATLPRLRYDQLMALGWKTLLPVAVANLIVVAIWIISTKLYGPGGGLGAAGIAALIFYILYLNIANVIRKNGGQALQKREVLLIDPSEVGAQSYFKEAKSSSL